VKFRNIPSKFLAANCVSALRPSEHVWERFLGEINKLKTQGDITEDQLAFLRYDTKVKHELTGLTYGNPDRVSYELVMQVLSQRENELTKPFIKEREKLIKISNEKDVIIAEKQLTIETIEIKIDKLGTLTESIINTLFLLVYITIFIACAYKTELINGGINLNNYPKFYNIITIIFVLLSISSFLGYKNTNPVFYISKKTNSALVRIIKNHFLSKRVNKYLNQ
jgi:hypothetical protein